MKAPFKVLYSNDLTNLLSCVSPYHKKGEDFTKTMLEASVDETAGTGVDVHMLQPGFGWVPLWQSVILPPEEHWAWLQKTYDLQTPDDYLKYLLDGGDIVADFTKHCRGKNLQDQKFLSHQPRHYFIGSHSLDDGSLPKIMMILGQHADFTIQNVSCLKGASEAKLQVHIDNPKAGDWEAWFNDQPVFKSADASEPLSKNVPGGQILTWEIPFSFINEGNNYIKFRSKDMQISAIDFIELIIGGKK